MVNSSDKKAICKSRPSNLLFSARRFWIVYESVYHVQAKHGFQFLGVDGGYLNTVTEISKFSPSERF